MALSSPTRCRITRDDFGTAVSEGLIVRDAACRFEVTPNTIRSWERRFGLRCRRKRSLALITEEELKKLVAEGLNTLQMGERLKATPGRVHYYLRKYGIKYQPHWRKPRHQALKLPGVDFAEFAKHVRDNFTKATVRVKGTLVMIDGRLIGEEGERWFGEKVRTAFPRRGQFSL